MDWLISFVDYNYTEHCELWSHLNQLDDETFVKNIGYSLGSIQREVVHMIRADTLWLHRAMQQPPPELLPDDTSDRAKIRAEWDALEAQVKTYVQTLTQADFDQPVTYINHDSIEVTQTRGSLILHFVNHGTVHRAEMCAMMHMLGHTVDFDVSYRRFMVEKSVIGNK